MATRREIATQPVGVGVGRNERGIKQNRTKRLAITAYSVGRYDGSATTSGSSNVTRKNAKGIAAIVTAKLKEAIEIEEN